MSGVGDGSISAAMLLRRSSCGAGDPAREVGADCEEDMEKTHQTMPAGLNISRFGVTRIRPPRCDTRSILGLRACVACTTGPSPASDRLAPISSCLLDFFLLHAPPFHKSRYDDAHFYKACLRLRLTNSGAHSPLLDACPRCTRLCCCLSPSWSCKAKARRFVFSEATVAA